MRAPRIRRAAALSPDTVVLVLLFFMELLLPTHSFSAVPMKSRFIGVDLGTSGARISVIEGDADYKEIYAESVQWETDKFGAYDEPDAWCKAVNDLLQGAADTISLECVRSICISGTSASCLLVEPARGDGDFVKPTRSPRMYNYNVDNAAALQLLQEFVPERHTARSPTGSLAKLLAWHAEQPVSENELLCHQADYVTRQFLASDKYPPFIASDWHNCLKLGYDVRALKWPSWLLECLQSAGLSVGVLPSPVVSPGDPVGLVRSDLCQRFGFPDTTVMVGGTTDSNAAFFAATGGSAVAGTAVTSLGSTLAIKQLSTTYVEDAEKGVYSHRFPAVFGSSSEAWLVGGASNVGCAVLRAQGFSNEELDHLSQLIDPASDSRLSYYPLTRKGERFPVADSNKKPIIEPVPDNRGDFLHGILQGISDVERDGFLALGDLGASPSTPCQVWTCGGGSRNDAWTKLRQRRLREAFGKDEPVNVAPAVNVEASFGAAILAAASFKTV
jgi:D-ribulokinase